MPDPSGRELFHLVVRMPEIYRLEKNEINNLKEALNSFLGEDELISKLSEVLARACASGCISYGDIKGIVKEDPEDLVMVAEEWRLLLPVSTAKSGAWEDRLLLLENEEVYEIPNVIRRAIKPALETGKWEPVRMMSELFKEMEDPAYKYIPDLIQAIDKEALDNYINASQLKKIFMEFGISNRVDGLIAELKSAGFMSPRLRPLSEVVSAGSPLYELNPAVICAIRVAGPAH